MCITNEWVAASPVCSLNLHQELCMHAGTRAETTSSICRFDHDQLGVQYKKRKHFDMRQLLWQAEAIRNKLEGAMYRYGHAWLLVQIDEISISSHSAPDSWRPSRCCKLMPLNQSSGKRPLRKQISLTDCKSCQKVLQPSALNLLHDH